MNNSVLFNFDICVLYGLNLLNQCFTKIDLQNNINVVLIFWLKFQFGVTMVKRNNNIQDVIGFSKFKKVILLVFLFHGISFNQVIPNGWDYLIINGLTDGGGAGGQMAIGDLTGDGIKDLVIAVPFESKNGVSLSGTVYVFEGGYEFKQNGNNDISNAYWSTSGETIEDCIGLVSIEIGDVNNDGNQDLAISSFSQTNIMGSPGQLYIFFGPLLQGYSSITTSDIKIEGVSASDGIGRDIKMSDLNYDGIDDLVIGAPNIDGNFLLEIFLNGLPELASTLFQIGTELYPGGEVYVFWGRENFPTYLNTNEADFTLLPNNSSLPLGGYPGYNLSIEDVNEDGRKDLITVDHGYHPFWTVYTYDIVSIVYGPLQAEQRSVDESDVIIHSIGKYNTSFGNIAAFCTGLDSNVNIFVDDANEGSIFIFDCPLVNQMISANDASVQLGVNFETGSKFAFGDLDSDGIEEMAITNGEVEVDGNLNAGMVFLLKQPFTTGNLESQAWLEIKGITSGQLLGESVEIGDIDGDGVDDLAIGVPGPIDIIGTSGEAGKVIVLFGKGGGANFITLTSDNYNADINCQINLTTIVLDRFNNPVTDEVIRYSCSNSGYFVNGNGNQATTNLYGEAFISYIPTAIGNHIITATAQSNNFSSQIDNPIVVSINQEPIFTSSQISPEPTGTPSTNFQFLITYQDSDGDPPDPLNSIKMIVNGTIDYSMAATSGSTNWVSGQPFETNNLQFTEGSYTYHFEGLQGDYQLRYPQTGELIFEVIPEDISGISLTLTPNPVTKNNFIEAKAVINPVAANYPIEFFQSNQSTAGIGLFVGNTSILTNEQGEASIQYYAQKEGQVRIFAIDGNNSAIMDYEWLNITEPELKFVLFQNRMGIVNNKVEYMFYFRVYNLDGNEYNESYNYTLTTDFGEWATSGSSTLTRNSYGSYAIDELVRFPSHGIANITLAVENILQNYSFNVQYSVPSLTPMTPSVTANGANFLSFSPTNDHIAFGTTDRKVKIYDIVSNQIIHEHVFINPTNNSSELQPNIVRYSPDGTKIFVGSQWGARIIDADNGTSLARNANIKFSSERPMNDAVWVNNDLILVAPYASYNLPAAVLNSSNLTQNTYLLSGSSYDFGSVDCKQNRAMVSSASYDGKGYLYNTSTWQNIRAYSAVNGGRVYAATISPDVQYSIISENQPYGLSKYNNSNGSKELSFGNNRNTYVLDWNPIKSDYLLSLEDIYAVVYNVNTGNPVAECTLPNESYKGEVAWSSNGEIFGTIGANQLNLYAPFDLGPPELTITSPNNNFHTNATLVQLEGYAHDDGGSVTIQYHVNTAAWQNLSLDYNNRFSELIPIEGGLNTIYVRATDQVGKSTTKTVLGNQITDQEPPLITNITVSNNRPETGETIVVTTSITDAGSTVDPNSVQNFIQQPDGATIQIFQMFDDGASDHGDDVAGDHVYSCKINTTDLAEAKHFCDIRASDNYANTNTIDNGADFTPYDNPHIGNVVHSPENPMVNELVTIHAEIEDRSGIVNAILCYDEVPFSDPDANPNGVLMESEQGMVYVAQIVPTQTGSCYYYCSAMDGAGNTINSSQAVMEISSLATTTYNFSQQAWYMLSISVIPQDSTVANLFPTALNETAYHWNSSTKTYDAVTKMEPQKGYWIAISEASGSTVSGVPVNSYTKHFSSAGWAMIGTVLDSVSFVNPNDSPDGMVLTPAYTWDGNIGNYSSADTLKAKTGYWIAVLGACDLTLDNVGSVSKTTTIAKTRQNQFFAQHGNTPPKPPNMNWGTGEIIRIPDVFALKQNYPNPFNPTTTIGFDLPEDCHVEVVIYNIMGQKMVTLSDRNYTAGSYEVLWDGRNDVGQIVSSGIHLCRIQAGRFHAVKKLVLVR